MSDTSDTIVACCTPQGGTGGSLALIRISGPQALSCADALSRLSNQQKISEQKTHTIHHGFVIDQTEAVVDEVLFLIMHAPRTFTGEDTVEITCHANPLLVNRIIALSAQMGARPALRGEFSQQAFSNNKIDLVQAEAIQELIHAATEQGIKASLAQLSGTLSSTIHELEKKIMTALAWCEASFEFIDEVGDFGNAIYEQISSIVAHIGGILHTHTSQHQIRDGIRIVLLGAVNAGKSSLFNTLIGTERAIVAPFAGTTRDSIEARVTRHQQIWLYVDTAGLRTTEDSIEQQGILRSWQEAGHADLILLLMDHSRAMSSEEHQIMQQLMRDHEQKIIMVLTKQDMPRSPQFCPPPYPYHCSVASATGAGITQLESLIAERITQLYAQHQLPYLVNQRHHTMLCAVSQELNTVLHLCSMTRKNYELISHHLRRCLELLGETTGKTAAEAAFDAVFREFCIGK